MKSWAEVLQACKARMHFVQEQLKANVDKDAALQYLKDTYHKYLVGVIDAQSSEATDQDAPDSEIIQDEKRVATEAVK